MCVLEWAQDYGCITHDNVPRGTTCKDFFSTEAPAKLPVPWPVPSRVAAVPAVAGFGQCADAGWRGPLHSIALTGRDSDKAQWHLLEESHTTASAQYIGTQAGARAGTRKTNKPH